MVATPGEKSMNYCILCLW